eukprot:TRINITY_DN0_c489_g1_i3.p3 TRINITY_DN0_c489_g1~~TRINITY_DN0_c489_g1_i3.p3  ORF type:complete len:101 (+),score=4.61 TRINITY_DN0_c489_g1_i3:1-303(+)
MCIRDRLKSTPESKSTSLSSRTRTTPATASKSDELRAPRHDVWPCRGYQMITANTLSQNNKKRKFLVIKQKQKNRIQSVLFHPLYMHPLTYSVCVRSFKS